MCFTTCGPVRAPKDSHKLWQRGQVTGYFVTSAGSAFFKRVRSRYTIAAPGIAPENSHFNSLEYSERVRKKGAG
jgi:hypothetical protein